MVFGWGKKNERKYEIETESLEKQISLSEVDEIANEIQTLRKKTLISESKSFQNKMNNQLDELLNIAKQLEKDDLKVDDIDKHLRIIVVRGKEQVISIINKEASFDFNKINSYDDVLQFDNEISQILKKIGDVLGRQTRVIHIFAKKYAEKLKTILSTLDTDAKELHTILDNYQKFEENIISISNGLMKINQIKNVQETGKKRLIELKNHNEYFNKKIESLQQEIKKLLDSNEYAEFQEIQRRIGSLDSEKITIKHDIDQQFTKISRALTKYGYISSLEKPQKILMEKLLQNPFDAISAENKANIIIILEAAKKGIETGSVSVKDTEKSVIHIEETISTLDNFINKISKFNLKKTELQNQLKIFNINEFERKRSELTKTQNDKNDLENKIHDLENEISESKTSIPNTIREIENKLREITSIKYTINQ
jgi:predicted  nucleic acid-binding Zn-ribbon protein